PPADATELLGRHGAAVDAHLAGMVARLATEQGAPPRLVESIHYSLTAGGKRLRPALVLECCHACGGDPSSAAALSAAAAIELIHTLCLVHDDLPDMDDDDLRRGQPTNHKVFGEAMAILAGDAMVTLAFETLATGAPPELSAALVRELARAAGPAGMIGGQVLDMAGENQSLALPQLQQIHRMKTGALLVASCRMGALAAAADATRVEAITDYGRHLGLAFQIVDDILDVTATPQQLGKMTNKDAGSGKNTYPRLIGLDPSRAAAREHVEAAVAALEPFGPPAAGLRAVARFVTARQF
ncbi:MAG TPA: farnesyl diphosphate synthase, partial [Tepidisphaeraceae bacterium]|nr:farnesyl diphosphate synthase [Tepidisphaeraceae bacterium]